MTLYCSSILLKVINLADILAPVVWADIININEYRCPLRKKILTRLDHKSTHCFGLVTEVRRVRVIVCLAGYRY